MALQDTDLLPLWRIADSSNRKISVADLSTYVSSGGGGLSKPGSEGSFVIVEDASGNITYSQIVDGGEYAT